MSKPVSERGVLRGLPEYAGEKAQRVALAQTEQDQTVEGGGGLTLSRGSADNTAFRWTAVRQSNDAAGLYTPWEYTVYNSSAVRPRMSARERTHPGAWSRRYFCFSLTQFWLSVYN